MTLDEMEEFAKATRSSDPNHQELILARAVLALLPVVRAAEAWRSALEICNTAGHDIATWRAKSRDELRALQAVERAVDTMRAALGGGE